MSHARGRQRYLVGGTPILCFLVSRWLLGSWRWWRSLSHIRHARTVHEIHKPRYKTLWRNFPFWCFWIYHALECTASNYLRSFPCHGYLLELTVSPLNMKDINELRSGSLALEHLKGWVETGAWMILKMKYWKKLCTKSYKITSLGFTNKEVLRSVGVKTPLNYLSIFNVMIYVYFMVCSVRHKSIYERVGLFKECSL
jgi:hypothetical protein